MEWRVEGELSITELRCLLEILEKEDRVTLSEEVREEGVTAVNNDESSLRKAKQEREVWKRERLASGEMRKREQERES